MYRFSVQFFFRCTLTTGNMNFASEHQGCYNPYNTSPPRLERGILCHTDLDTIAVISYGHHWWDSSHYTLIYMYKLLHYKLFDNPIESK